MLGSQGRFAAGDQAFQSVPGPLLRVKGKPPSLERAQPESGLVIGDDRVIDLQVAQVGQGSGRSAPGQAYPDLQVGRGEDRPRGTGRDGEELKDVPALVEGADTAVEVAELIIDADAQVTFRA